MDKPLVWLQSEVRSPPFSVSARVEAGILLRRLQRGDTLGLPHSRPMPSIGDRCHELRINDGGVSWRLVYRIDSDAVIIVGVFKKKTQATPRRSIGTCRRRLDAYDVISGARE